MLDLEMFSETQESAPTWELLFSTPLLFWPLSEHVRFPGLRYLKWVENKECGVSWAVAGPQNSVNVTCWKETFSRTPLSLTLFFINPLCLRGRIQISWVISCLGLPYAFPVLALKILLPEQMGWMLALCKNCGLSVSDVEISEFP